MKIETTATNRQDVVKALEELTGENKKYLGPPTFAYQIGAYIVNRNGDIEIEDTEAGEMLQKELIERGFAEEPQPQADLAVPMEGRDGNGIRNLIFMAYSKQYLLEKAVGVPVFKITEELVNELQELEKPGIEDVVKRCNEANCYGLEFSEDKIHFTGFPFDTERMRAFAELICMMAAGAQKQKRVNPKETIEENEKYYMRIWLIRLGFNGTGGKETRTVFLEKLKGNSAFRTEEEMEKAKERNRIKRHMANE